MPSTRIAVVPGIFALTALALAGCVPNAPSQTAAQVNLTDTGCAVTPTTATSGAIAFKLSNTGSDLNEFEIFAEDQLRIVGEKENVTPGQTVDYVVQLQPGTYYTACKFRQVGSPIGVAKFRVTGGTVQNSASDQARIDQAVQNYLFYVKSEVEAMIPVVNDFAAAYEAGDDQKARSLFASTRAYYERIEPTASSFGDLDPKIDYREVDAVAQGLDWTGFHRIEKDLWPPAAGTLNSDGTDANANWSASTPAERKVLGEGLIADVQQLYDLVHASSFAISLGEISNGAIGLLDEVAKNKITGEEDWWSHTDLSDFAANVQGAEVAFGDVKDIASAKGGSQGAQLVTQISDEFAKLDALLAKYGSLDKGFISYDQITDPQRKELINQVIALAEPLSQLTHTVLGVAQG